MANGTDNIKTSKPKVGGGIFRAPLGTAVPTDFNTPLDAAFKSLGYVSEEGVVRSEEYPSDPKVAWGGDEVADLPGTHALNFSATLLEGRNAEALKAIRGEENVTVDDATGAITVKTNSKRAPRAVYVIESDSVRDVIFDAQISLSGDVTYVHNDVIQYEVSWKAFPNADGDKSAQYFPADNAAPAVESV